MPLEVFCPPGYALDGHGSCLPIEPAASALPGEPVPPLESQAAPTAPGLAGTPSPAAAADRPAWANTFFATAVKAAGVLGRLDHPGKCPEGELYYPPCSRCISIDDLHKAFLAFAFGTGQGAPPICAALSSTLKGVDAIGDCQKYKTVSPQPGDPTIDVREACPHGLFRDPVTLQCVDFPGRTHGDPFYHGTNVPQLAGAPEPSIAPIPCSPGFFRCPKTGECTPLGPLHRQAFTVQAGETTSAAAARAGVTADALVAANPTVPRVLVGGRAVFAALREGQELLLP